MIINKYNTNAFFVLIMTSTGGQKQSLYPSLVHVGVIIVRSDGHEKTVWRLWHVPRLSLIGFCKHCHYWHCGIRLSLSMATITFVQFTVTVLSTCLCLLITLCTK